MSAKKPTSYFIDRCKTIHGDLYDYSMFEAESRIMATDKVSIICKTHGIFEQKFSSHMNGNGCPQCKAKNLHDLHKFDLDTFITRANELHNNRYSYCRLKYYNSKTKVIITCHEHGDFEQIAGDHLGGSGCPLCRAALMSKLLRLDTISFVNKATSVHELKYDYSKTIYTLSKNKVIIGCPKHGYFEQEASSHLSGSGCQKCCSRVSIVETEWLDAIGIPHGKEARQKLIRIPGIRSYQVDGFDSATNTAYLFHGDYWHGNPLVFSADDWNVRVKKTYGQLYRETLEMEQNLRDAGYNVVSKWQTSVPD